MSVGKFRIKQKLRIVMYYSESEDSAYECSVLFLFYVSGTDPWKNLFLPVN